MAYERHKEIAAAIEKANWKALPANERASRRDVVHATHEGTITVTLPVHRLSDGTVNVAADDYDMLAAIVAEVGSSAKVEPTPFPLETWYTSEEHREHVARMETLVT